MHRWSHSANICKKNGVGKVIRISRQILLYAGRLLACYLFADIAHVFAKLESPSQIFFHMTSSVIQVLNFFSKLI